MAIALTIDEIALKRILKNNIAPEDLEQWLKNTKYIPKSSNKYSIGHWLDTSERLLDARLQKTYVERI